MRIIAAKQVTEAVAEAVVDVNYHLAADVLAAIERAIPAETSPVGREVLGQIVENARIAAEGKYPLCQDTGLPVIFVELGEDARVEGGLYAAIEAGVRKGAEEGYLRKAVCDPFTRKNTGDNAPPIIHLTLVPGDKLTLNLMTKGGGAENMSKAVSLSPLAGREGIVSLVIDTVRAGAVNACPPLIIGVGVGGDLEYAAEMAKRSLTRPLNEHSPDKTLAELERELLDKINRLGIGPGGLGGRTTALAVHALSAPCHIASLPVAVVLECHSHRYKRITI